MKVIFVGPSLHGAPADRIRQLFLVGAIERRGPAKQGDILRATLEGATSIGLVDGYYDDIAAPWHREILFALSRGTVVFGGASIGAIRAAECVPFGMIGVGKIYERYVSGEITDDADVALLHAPEELNYMPLTVPMVEVDATLETLVNSGVCSFADAARMSDCARTIFFKDRTWEKILAAHHEAGAAAVSLDDVLARLAHVKALDAIDLIESMARRDDKLQSSAPDWRLSETRIWKDVYQKAVDEIAGG